MMRAIFGTGALARECWRWYLDLNLATSELLFLRDGLDSEPNFFMRRPVRSILDISYPLAVFIAVGDSRARAGVLERIGILRPDWSGFSLRHLRACSAGIFGAGLLLAPGAVVSVDTVGGAHCHIHYGASVGHDVTMGDCVTISPGATVCGWVELQSRVFIGAGATVRNGTSSKPLVIGEGAYIGMGAVVTRDVPTGERWLGNPARRS